MLCHTYTQCDAGSSSVRARLSASNCILCCCVFVALLLRIPFINLLLLSRVSLLHAHVPLPLSSKSAVDAVRCTRDLVNPNSDLSR